MFIQAGSRKPQGTFTVVVPKETAPAGKVTLLEFEWSNLQGYREEIIDVTVTG